MELDKEDLRKMISDLMIMMDDFKKTQPRKKRQNINKAFLKLPKGEPLNRLEREALEEYLVFYFQYDESKKG